MATTAQAGGAGEAGETAGAAGQDQGRRATPWLLLRLQRRYAMLVAARLREADLGGLPRAAYWLVMALASGARDASQLVGAMGVTKQSVSKVVDTLVTEGFVERSPNEDDRRRTDLVLSDKGVRTAAVIRSALREAELGFVEEVGAAAWESAVATLALLAGSEG